MGSNITVVPFPYPKHSTHSHLVAQDNAVAHDEVRPLFFAIDLVCEPVEQLGGVRQVADHYLKAAPVLVKNCFCSRVAHRKEETNDLGMFGHFS